MGRRRSDLTSFEFSDELDKLLVCGRRNAQQLAFLDDKSVHEIDLSPAALANVLRHRGSLHITARVLFGPCAHMLFHFGHRIAVTFRGECKQLRPDTANLFKLKTKRFSDAYGLTA